jgi:hypothetical protein
MGIITRVLPNRKLTNRNQLDINAVLILFEFNIHS